MPKQARRRGTRFRRFKESEAPQKRRRVRRALAKAWTRQRTDFARDAFDCYISNDSVLCAAAIPKPDQPYPFSANGYRRLAIANRHEILFEA
jgi:hypothetical protein